MAERTIEKSPATERRRVPDMATHQAGASHPYIEATPMFLWTFHGERWMVLDGRLVPSLQKVPLIAGVNGMEVDKDKRIRFAACRARLEDQGRIEVRYEWAPDGVSYLQCVDTRPDAGKTVLEAWISVFESAHVGATETSCDEEAFAEWLEDLVKAGRLPACPHDTARRMLERATSRYQRARAEAAKLGGHGNASVRAKALEAEVKTLEAYVKVGKATRAAAKAKANPKLDDASAGGGE